MWYCQTVHRNNAIYRVKQPNNPHHVGRIESQWFAAILPSFTATNRAFHFRSAISLEVIDKHNSIALDHFSIAYCRVNAFPLQLKRPDSG
jgi:hypothetical protein